MCPISIDTVCSHIDNEIIPQRFRSTKKVDVTEVEKVVGAVGYYFGHEGIISLRYVKCLELSFY